MSADSGKILFLLGLIFLSCSHPFQVLAQEDVQPPPVQAVPAEQPPQQRLALTRAVMIEKVENNTPVNSAAVFSVIIGQVHCFTSFNPVPQPTLIYHRWYHRDELSTQIRLRLYPPKWSTYSAIQLRETDKGPWRVEVSDQNGNVLTVVRFSITD